MENNRFCVHTAKVFNTCLDYLEKIRKSDSWRYLLFFFNSQSNFSDNDNQQNKWNNSYDKIKLIMIMVA